MFPDPAYLSQRCSLRFPRRPDAMPSVEYMRLAWKLSTLTRTDPTEHQILEDMALVAP